MGVWSTAVTTALIDHLYAMVEAGQDISMWDSQNWDDCSKHISTGANQLTGTECRERYIDLGQELKQLEQQVNSGKLTQIVGTQHFQSSNDTVVSFPWLWNLQGISNKSELAANTNMNSLAVSTSSHSSHLSAEQTLIKYHKYKEYCLRLRNENEKLNFRLEAARKTEEQSKAHIHALEEKSRLQNGENISRLRNELDENVKYITALEKLNSGLKSSNQRFTEQLKMQEEETSDLRMVNTQLSRRASEKSVELLDKIAKLEKNLQDEKTNASKAQDLRAQLVTLRDRLSEAEMKLQRKGDSLATDSDDLKEQVRKLQRENSVLRGANEALGSKIKNVLNSRKSGVHVEVEDDLRVYDLELQIAALQNSLNCANDGRAEDLKKAESQVAGLKEQLRKAEFEVAALKEQQTKAETGVMVLKKQLEKSEKAQVEIVQSLSTEVSKRYELERLNQTMQGRKPTISMGAQTASHSIDVSTQTDDSLDLDMALASEKLLSEALIAQMETVLRDERLRTETLRIQLNISRTEKANVSRMEDYDELVVEKAPKRRRISPMPASNIVVTETTLSLPKRKRPPPKSLYSTLTSQKTYSFVPQKFPELENIIEQKKRGWNDAQLDAALKTLKSLDEQGQLTLERRDPEQNEELKKIWRLLNT